MMNIKSTNKTFEIINLMSKYKSKNKPLKAINIKMKN